MKIVLKPPGRVYSMRLSQVRLLERGMSARSAEVRRETKETTIRVEVNLDGKGNSEFQTGLPFLDHMLDQVARHGMMDIRVHARGDLEIDAHHSVEDIGITLGQAFT